MDQDQPLTLHITTVDLTPWCFLRSWFRCLREHGYPVVLACTVTKFRADLEASGAEVIDIPIARRISPLQDFISLLKLIRLIRRLRPQLVHTHTSKAGFIGRLAARLCGVPHIVHTVHELPQNAAHSPWLIKFYQYLEKFAAQYLCDHLITVSQPNYQQITSLGIASPEKLTLIREGLDHSKYEPYHRQNAPGQRSAAEIRAEFAVPDGAPLICSVGRLEEAKGHSDLLRAFQQVSAILPQARLVIVGGGHLQGQLQKELLELGLQGHAVLAGWRDDMLDILAACDLYALASHYEGLGIATMEAMALERPVVCTGVGGVLDVVIDGVTGHLAPAHNPRAFAEKMLDLLNNPDKARQFAEAGYRRVQEEFHDDTANKATLALYREIMSR
ncbi:MAG: glycosyltransferase family 4 protein [bacterium]|nr:glycosyltransferase family 4 protein [bacterium]